MVPLGGDSSSEDGSAMPSATTEAVVHNNRMLMAQKPRPGVDFYSDDEDRKVSSKFATSLLRLMLKVL